MSNGTSLHVPEVRRAQTLILAGEALIVTVRFRATQPRQAPAWAETLGSPDVLADLESAATKAAKKVLGNTTRVAVEPSAPDALVYRLFAYRRFGSESPLQLSTAGARLEQQMLTLTSALATRAETIVSKAARVPVILTTGWAPGPGLATGAGQSLAKDADEDLSGRIQDLDIRARSIRTRSVLGMGLGALSMIGGLTASLFFGLYELYAAALSGYGLLLIFVAYLLLTRVSDTKQEIRELRDQQDLRELSQEWERRAQKQCQVHSYELRRYYQQALRQRGAIFGVGVLSILAGFGVIVGASLMITKAGTKLPEQIVIGALGAVGGILAN